MARSSVLLLLILFITFPFWIAIGGMALGLFMGLIGIIFGMIGAAFGIFFGILGGIFHFVFGLGSWHSHHFFNKYIFIALLIFVAVAISKKTRKA